MKKDLRDRVIACLILIVVSLTTSYFGLKIGQRLEACEQIESSKTHY